MQETLNNTQYVFDVHRQHYALAARYNVQYLVDVSLLHYVHETQYSMQ